MKKIIYIKMNEWKEKFVFLFRVNEMKRRSLYIILLLLVTALLLKGCLKKDYGFDKEETADLPPLEQVKWDLPSNKNITIDGIDYLQSQAPVGKFGGDLRDSSIGEGPKTFNYWSTNDNTSSTMSGLMYDGLLRTNPLTGKQEPRLAKSFEVMSDKKTYIVKMRRGIKWSDGREITADDVVFTYNVIIFQGFGNPSMRDVILVNGKLPKVEKVDEYTVKFTTPEPFAPFLGNLTSPIAPKHIFEPVTKRGKAYFNTFYSTATPPSEFVTSSAFKLKQYVPAQRVVFERNPNYYIINKDGEKLPYLDRYIISIVGDINNETLKFEAGEIDILSLQPAVVQRFRELEKNSDYKLYNLGTTTSTTFFTFNLNNRKNDKGKFYVEPKKSLWFNDLNFRTAVDLALDRDSLVLNVLAGVGQPLFSPESPSSLFLNEAVAKGHERDIEKARKILKESGYNWDKDGALHDKQGNRVEFELLTNAGNTPREATGVSIKEDLAQLGIKVNFKPIEFNSLVNRISNSLDWDTIILALTGNPLEPNSGKNVWESTGALHLFNQRKEGEAAPPLPFERELDEIYNKGALELDFAKRKKFYERYQEIVYEQKPMLYLYSPINIAAVRKTLGNVYPTQLGGVLWNIEEIYVR